jgi:hypothetical protein
MGKDAKMFDDRKDWVFYEGLDLAGTVALLVASKRWNYPITM